MKTPKGAMPHDSMSQRIFQTYGILWSTLCSDLRFRILVKIRTWVMLYYEEHGYIQEEISAVFGIHRTTFVHGKKEHANMLAYSDYVQEYNYFRKNVLKSTVLVGYTIDEVQAVEEYLGIRTILHELRGSTINDTLIDKHIMPRLNQTFKEQLQ
jgi:hypothetical protein